MITWSTSKRERFVLRRQSLGLSPLGWDDHGLSVGFLDHRIDPRLLPLAEVTRFPSPRE